MDRAVLEAVAELSARGELEETWGEAARVAALAARRRKAHELNKTHGEIGEWGLIQALERNHEDHFRGGLSTQDIHGLADLPGLHPAVRKAIKMAARRVEPTHDWAKDRAEHDAAMKKAQTPMGSSYPHRSAKIGLMFSG